MSDTIAFENHVNVDNDPDPFIPRYFPGTKLTSFDLTAIFLAIAFIYTAIVAVSYAKKKDYFNHKVWIMRQVEIIFL